MFSVNLPQSNRGDLERGIITSLQIDCNHLYPTRRAQNGILIAFGDICHILINNTPKSSYKPPETETFSINKKNHMDQRPRENSDKLKKKFYELNQTIITFHRTIEENQKAW